MEKHPTRPNGFTMLEACVMLLVVSLLLTLSPARGQSSSLPLFMEGMVLRLTTLQQRAFAAKEKVKVQIQETRMEWNGNVWNYPSDIACTPFSLGYNEKGNITMAQTVICTNGKESMKLVFQLGSGRIRYEAA